MKFATVLVMAVVAAMLSACGDDDASTTPTSATATETDAATREFSSENFTLGVSMTADASWSVDVDEADLFILKHFGDSTYPTGYVEVLVPSGVNSYDGLSVEPVPADLAGWLRNHPGLIQKGVAEAIFGRLAGLQIDVGADEGSSFPLLKLGEGAFEVNYTDRIRFYVFDGPTGPLVIAAHTDPAAVFDRLVPLFDPLVQTIRFDNGSPAQ